MFLVTGLGSDPYQEEVLTKLADRAFRYNSWLFERARAEMGERVVDVGAGLGTFTELAGREAREVVAIEPDAQLVELLTSRFGPDSNVRVVRADVTDLSRDLVGFAADSVLCLNVLEHIRDDVDALARMRNVLVPGGKLFLLVPAHDWLFGSLDRSAKHERRYQRRRLRRLLEGAGFEVRTLRHVNPLGIVGWFVWGRILGAAGLPPGPLGAYDRLVPLLRLLDAVRLPVGLSLWAVAERPR
jgi:SAM-dependent methyltransferase